MQHNASMAPHTFFWVLAGKITTPQHFLKKKKREGMGWSELQTDDFVLHWSQTSCLSLGTVAALVFFSLHVFHLNTGAMGVMLSSLRGHQINAAHPYIHAPGVGDELLTE